MFLAQDWYSRAEGEWVCVWYSCTSSSATHSGMFHMGLAYGNASVDLEINVCNNVLISSSLSNGKKIKFSENPKRRRHCTLPEAINVPQTLKQVASKLLVPSP